MRIIDKGVTIRRLGPQINLYIMPDCHFGSEAFLESEYERLASVIEKDPIARVIFQGDILDSNRPSTRKIKKVAYHDREDEYKQEDARNEFWIESKILPKLQRIIKTPDRCLGMMDGDHFLMMENGLTSTQLLCGRLGVPYLGDGQALMNLNFNYNGIKNKVVIHVQHGLGGSGRPGSGVNKLEDTANIWDGVDVFVRGHSHKGFIFPVSKYSQLNGSIIQRDIWLINTPSFRTGLIMGKTDYAEARNYSATAHKFPVLHIDAVKDQIHLSATLI